ncbi:LysR substrate-binding domain-containing protein [Chitinophaga qingshengii]|uniref:LysR family transcriptional regulator n=1 Tax=Chitinophaga qingshengii TaxID=1569794 RepID=A0ABR7TTU8_9BACT|nr:LysR substrate-binding domain-containing protein [Chitinophaga qingshengii]MBC9932876.1 LysR family transcriptional regulator [Chitinophaga qingshengii]
MNTDVLDLDLLRTFVLAVDLGSFARAAEQVARSQSAVSLQMQRLEELTGHQLFVKQGRSWELTGSGELLMGYARQLLRLNDEAVAALSTRQLAGMVRLGMLTDFSEGGLTQVLARFAEQHPRVQMEVTIDKQVVLQQKLKAGQLDLIVCFGTTLPEGALLIGKVPLRWIGNNNKAIAQQSPLPLLLFEPPCLFRAAGLAALEKSGKAWKPVLTASNVAGMWAAAKAGLGITIRTPIGLPADCKLLPVSGTLPALPQITVYLLIAPRKKTSAAILRMIEIVQETLSAELKNIHPPKKK